MPGKDGRVALTVLGDDFYDHISLRGSVVEMYADPDWADVDRLSRHYRGTPFPHRPDHVPTTAIVEISAWHEFRSKTQPAPAG